MTQELYNKVFGVHKQICQAEAEIGKMREGFSNMIQAMKYVEEARALDMKKSKLLNHLSEMKGSEHFHPEEQ